MRKANLTNLFALWILSLAIVCTASGKIIYVDHNASGADNGNSWADAYNDLQDALSSAQTGDEIRVAQGIYTPIGPIVPIPPGQASNPYPADGAIDVNVNSNLSWTAGTNACIYDVYFGISSPPPFVGSQSSIVFSPDTMAENTMYYWRIDSVNISGKTTGIVWSFTTHEVVSPPPPPWPPGGSSSEQAAPAVINRTATFQLKNGVIIMGGYAGFGAPDPNARDMDLYETILSGDIGIPCDNSDNSYHVVTGSGTDETAVLDGFTITAGNGYNGGGMYNLDGSPTVINCIFTGNLANDRGGGMYNEEHSSPTVMNCIFTGNSVEYSGGGMFNCMLSNPTLTNCTFNGNTAGGSGGGIYNDCSPMLTNCTFTGNTAEHFGGGMLNLQSSPALTNCTFSKNSAIFGGGICNIIGGNPTLTGCTFSGNWADYGGGMNNSEYTTAVVTNCKFSGNLAREEGGGMYNGQSSNPMLTNCVFGGNLSSCGAGMYNNALSSPTLTNCIISDNSTCGEDGPTGPFSKPSGVGGGMYNNWSSPMLTNCIISNNCALCGAAMYCIDLSSSTLINCTVSGNRALLSRYGGICNDSQNSVLLKNCILWANSYHEQITGPATVTYSDVQNGYAGAGNINADPCFVQPQYLGPIIYWKFDEANGTRVYNFVGYYSEGRLDGPQRTAGQVHSALSFDGIDDNVPIHNGPHNFKAITLQAWIYPRKDSHWHVLDRGDGETRLYSEGTSLTLDGSVRYTGDNAFSRSVSNTVILNTWQHVALTWSRADDTTRLYHNGVDVDYSIRTIGTGSPEDTSNSWVIGASSALGELTFFDGLIDEAAIYDRVLSADEIQQHYQNGLSGSGYLGVNLPDYHLLSDSPCIDSGDPNYIAGPNETDLEGHPRIIDGDCNDTDVVDMGAHEFNYAYIGDFDYDCDVDFEDFAIFGLSWVSEPGEGEWNRFCDIDIPSDNYINWSDLDVFVDNWLACK